MCPRPLKRKLADDEILTIVEMGWLGKTNSDNQSPDMARVYQNGVKGKPGVSKHNSEAT